MLVNGWRVEVVGRRDDSVGYCKYGNRQELLRLTVTCVYNWWVVLQGREDSGLRHQVSGRVVGLTGCDCFIGCLGF